MFTDKVDLEDFEKQDPEYQDLTEAGPGDSGRL